MLLEDFKKVDLIKTDLIDFKNMIDVISLFNKDRISVSIYNIFATIINKQIELKKNNIPFPFIIFNNQPDTINVEYNAFVLGVGSLLSEATRNDYIDNYKISQDNFRKNIIKNNFSLMIALEYASNILYSFGNVLPRTFKFYKPIVYELSIDKEQKTYIQMACISFSKKPIIELLKEATNDVNNNLILDNLDFYDVFYEDKIIQKAFANAECEKFWKSVSKNGFKKTLNLSI